MFFKRILKVKKVEKKKLEKDKTAFLIYRYYRDSYVEEFLVCINYKFRTNTYEKGILTDRLDLAYNLFNQLVKNGQLPNLRKEVDND